MSGQGQSAALFFVIGSYELPNASPRDALQLRTTWKTLATAVVFALISTRSP
jgi:hypothetical protein